MAKELAIVLNNGSLNSAVVSALAAQKYRPVFLHAQVEQQKPGTRARVAYDQQVQHFSPYGEHTIPLPAPTGPPPPGGRGAAAAKGPQKPAEHPSPVLTPGPLVAQLIDLLPLVATAARLAAYHQAAAIYLGLRVGPDGDDLAQATEYVQIWDELLQTPCAQPDLNVEAPLLELEPWEMVDLGFQVGAPFDRTWSCAEREAQEPCWACRGCRAREAAFQQAGKPDPLRAVRR